MYNCSIQKSYTEAGYYIYRLSEKDDPKSGYQYLGKDGEWIPLCMANRPFTDLYWKSEETAQAALNAWIQKHPSEWAEMVQRSLMHNE